jgi:hypothetical protein
VLDANWAIRGFSATPANPLWQLPLFAFFSPVFGKPHYAPRFSNILARALIFLSHTFQNVPLALFTLFFFCPQFAFSLHHFRVNPGKRAEVAGLFRFFEGTLCKS